MCLSACMGLLSLPLSLFLCASLFLCLSVCLSLSPLYPFLASSLPPSPSLPVMLSLWPWYENWRPCLVSIPLFCITNCKVLPKRERSHSKCQVKAVSSFLIKVMLLGCWCFYMYFRNALTVGMDSPLFLPNSDRCDSVLCSTVADVNWDSVKELVLGTYGQVSDLLESVNCAQIVHFHYSRIACSNSGFTLWVPILC